MKNITFRAEEELIQRARERAKANHTTLNEEFRNWLETYAASPEAAAAYTDLMSRFSYVRPGRSFERDEMD